MSQGLSLHIGLNSVDSNAYEGWLGTLLACENDADSMEDLAASMGYKTKHLKTQSATRTAVKDVIRKAAEDLHTGDILLLTYSGHGGQVKDTNGDEPDGRDETWVLYDGELVDDELHELYTQFKAGVRIVVLSDSCHSGSVVRAMYEKIAPIEADYKLRNRGEFRSKAIPPDVQQKVVMRHSKELARIQEDTKDAAKRSPEATVILISGCQDRQLSSDGDVNGLFTESLLQVWNSWKGKTFKQDYRRFQKAIKRIMPPSQQPNYFVTGGPNRAFEQERPFTIDEKKAVREPAA